MSGGRREGDPWHWRYASEARVVKFRLVFVDMYRVHPPLSIFDDRVQLITCPFLCPDRSFRRCVLLLRKCRRPASVRSNLPGTVYIPCEKNEAMCGRISHRPSFFTSLRARRIPEAVSSPRRADSLAEGRPSLPRRSCRRPEEESTAVAPQRLTESAEPAHQRRRLAHDFHSAIAIIVF